jgi:hypothetical protein
MEILPSRPGNLDETLVYYVGPDGRIMLAPDNKIKNPSKLGLVGWHGFEAKTAHEKDSVSARMAAQLHERKRKTKIEQRMREQFQRDVLRANARIRISKGVSPLDVECNKSILRRMDEDDVKFYKELCEDFKENRTACLEIERKEAPIGLAARGDKRQGLA